MGKVPLNVTIDESLMDKIQKRMKKKQWGLSFVVNEQLNKSFGVVSNE